MPEETIPPQWICMTCKTVIGPIVDDDEHTCKCKDIYDIELWLVEPVSEDDTHQKTCPECQGKGKITFYLGIRPRTITRICDRCHGSGVLGCNHVTRQ